MLPNDSQKISNNTKWNKAKQKQAKDSNRITENHEYEFDMNNNYFFYILFRLINFMLKSRAVGLKNQ